jgi:hypothetical protein
VLRNRRTNKQLACGKTKSKQIRRERNVEWKSHQQIFDHIIATSTFKIHDVAEMIRKIPTLEKRKKYAFAQIMLLVMIGLFIAVKIVSGFEISIVFNQLRLTIAIVSLIIPLFLFYGVLMYKRNIHLVTGIWMIYGAVMNVSVLIVTLSVVSVICLFICISGASLAFYLNSKLVSSYMVNKELKKNNPEQRENVITFID